MRPLPSVTAFALLCSLPLLAQGGGRFRGRAEEILNRVGVFFSDTRFSSDPRPASDTKAPPAEGEQAADLAQCDLVKAAAARGQLTVLYLVDDKDDPDARTEFERTLFAGDEIGIELRCFHCGRIDLGSERALAAKYGKQAPAFVVFDKDGKAGEVVGMSGYKPSPKALQAQLERAANSVIKPSLAAFAKQYGELVQNLEQTIAKRKTVNDRVTRAGDDAGKKAEAAKDLAAVDKEEKKLRDQETQLLAKYSLPARPADARRLGGRGPGRDAASRNRRGEDGKGGAPGGGGGGGGGGGNAGGSGNGG